MYIKNNEFSRLKKVADTHFKNLSNLSVLLGKSKQQLHTYKNRSEIGRYLLKELESIGINPRYIQYGEEPMLLQKSADNINDVDFEKENTGNHKYGSN